MKAKTTTKPRPNEVVLAGLTRKQLRDYLRDRNRGGSGLSTANTVWRFFDDMDEQRATEVQAALIAEGYVEAEEPHELTQKGKQASGKLLIKRMTRAKADALVAELIERAKAFNDDGSEPYYVHSIHAFGSYANEAADSIGDIDVVPIVAKRADAGSIDHGNVPPEGLLKIHKDGRGAVEHVSRILRDSNPYFSMHNAEGVIGELKAPLHKLFDASDHPFRDEPTHEQSRARAEKALRHFTATALRLLVGGTANVAQVDTEIRALAEAWEGYHGYPFDPVAHMLDIERDENERDWRTYGGAMERAEEDMRTETLRLLAAELDDSRLHISKSSKALAKARDHYVNGIVAMDRGRCKRVSKYWPYSGEGGHYKTPDDIAKQIEATRSKRYTMKRSTW